jgi:hypothetical protein
MASVNAHRASVKPSPVHQLSIAAAFNGLTESERQYAHHMSRFVASLDYVNNLVGFADRKDARAAWEGTRIILRQTSPEAEHIFDMIITLYKECDGDWQKLATQNGLEDSDVEAFIDYAACFLSNVGNYYASSQTKNTDRSVLTHIQGIWRPEVCSQSITRKATTNRCKHSRRFIAVLRGCCRHIRSTSVQPRFPK